MTVIGIRELKAHLSQYLKRVEAGEYLTVPPRTPDRNDRAGRGRPNVDWVRALIGDGRAQWSGENRAA